MAEAHFRLNVPDDKGLSLRQRFTANENAGIPTPDWHPPPLPPELSHIWNWFCELDAGRHFRDDNRPEPISYFDILAWSELTGRRHLVGPFEARTLKLLDACYFEVLRNPTATPEYLSDEIDISSQLKAAFRLAKGDKKSDSKFLS